MSVSDQQPPHRQTAMSRHSLQTSRPITRSEIPRAIMLRAEMMIRVNAAQVNCLYGVVDAVHVIPSTILLHSNPLRPWWLHREDRQDQHMVGIVSYIWNILPRRKSCFEKHPAVSGMWGSGMHHRDRSRTSWKSLGATKVTEHRIPNTPQGSETC